MIFRLKQITFITLAAVIGIGCCGCQSWETQGKLPLFSRDKKEKKTDSPPEKIVAVWTEATHHHPGKKAERGFGSRIVFYDAQDRPLEITGKVTVFVFDDQHPAADEPAPKYKFVFPEEVIASHYSKSDLGHSYSFWIPLAAIDSPTIPFSLVVRYDSPQGERVLSDLTKKVLVGTGIKTTRQDKKREPAPATSAADDLIRQASFQASFNETAPSSKKRRSLETGAHGQVETIEVSPNFSRRLQSIHTSPSQEFNRSLDNGNASFNPGSESGEIRPAVTNQQKSAKPLTSTNVSTLRTGEQSGTGTADNMRQEAGSLSLSQMGFAPRRSQAPWRSGFQPTGAAPRRDPHPGGWQLGLPPTPRTGFGSGSQANDPTSTGLAARARLWFEQINENPTEMNQSQTGTFE